MFTTLLLGSALTAGQAPAPPGAYWPPAAQPFVTPVQAAPMPAPTGPTGQPAPMPGGLPPPPPAAANGNGNGNGNGCDACEKKEEEETPATKYFLEKLLENSPFGQCLAERGIKIRGWAGMNYSFSEARQTNFPIEFNDRPDFYMLNQNWIEVQKDIDTSKKERQFGYRMSWIAPGTDYRLTLPRGLWNDQLADGNFYGFDPVYHYAEVYMPNLGAEGSTFRIGRWATLIGYEQIEAIAGPFLSKSYNFQYDPFTHTGAMITTPLNDTWTMYHGAVTGSDVYIDPAAQLTYVGGIKWAPPEGKTSIALNTVVTNPRFLPVEGFTHYNCYNLLITHKVTEKLTYVLDSTLGHTRDVPDIGAANWYGFANYFLWQATDKLASNLRIELFEDTKGFRTGFSGLYTEVTYGLSWVPVDALILRPWVRYDYNAESRPWDGQRDLFTGGIEAVVRW